MSDIKTVTAFSFNGRIFATQTQAELASAHCALRNLESLKNVSHMDLQHFEEWRRHAHTLLKNLDNILSELSKDEKV